MQNLEREVEEAAATLGAGRLRTFVTVIAPSLLPAVLTGFALAFARAIGEYGSIVFISGNLPFKTEIAPYLIVMRLEEYDYTGAIALAVVLLVFSFLLLGAINLLEHGPAAFRTLKHDRIPDRVEAQATESPRGTEESPLVKWTLIAIALAFCFVFLLLPLVNVFAQALGARAGRYYWRSLAQPDSLAAIRLTLLVAAISVPLERAVRAGGRVGDCQVPVPGQVPADHAD